MDARLAVAIIGVLLGLYYFLRGQRAKREEIGPVPDVTDDELQILREIEKNGGARREMHPVRPSLQRAGTINSIWFGLAPVDSDQCQWIYDLIEKDLKHKGPDRVERASILPALGR